MLKQLAAKAVMKGISASVGNGRMLMFSAQQRRRKLTADLEAAVGNRVCSGPFRGMALVAATSWGDGDRASKLLGVYEANLHDHILNAVARTPNKVINVGCAEGYYAVGLARLLPKAVVYAYDIDAKAIEVCRLAALENGVIDRVALRSRFSPEELSQIITDDDRPLIIMDCEGGELQLLDPATAPGLASCDIIVETHDFAVRGITEIIKSRLAATHDIVELGHGSRDSSSVPYVRRLSELDQLLLMWEARPESMNWLVCLERRSRSPGQAPPLL